MLATLGRQNALRLNFQIALNNGAQLNEIFEAIMQVAVYAGYPAAWDALVILEEVLHELEGGYPLILDGMYGIFQAQISGDLSKFLPKFIPLYNRSIACDWQHANHQIARPTPIAVQDGFS